MHIAKWKVRGGIAVIVVLILMFIGLLINCLQGLAVPLSASVLEVYEDPLDSHPADQARNVSIISLIAVPERYDGQHVKIYGFINLSVEPVLYLSKDDLQYGIARNGIKLQMTENEIAENLLNQGDFIYAGVEGVFRSDGTEMEPRGVLEETYTIHFESQIFDDDGTWLVDLKN